MGKYSSSTPMLDIIFGILAIFIIMFAIAFMMINNEESEKQPKYQAAYIVTISWEDGSPHDVDTYVKDPVGNIVSFGRREQGLMHLDRDDLGQRNDIIYSPDGEVKLVKTNEERVYIRDTIEGEYIVNVHMYSKQPNEEFNGSTKVKAVLQKIVPYSQVVEREVELYDTGDEKTCFRFTIDKDNNVGDVNTLSIKIATNYENIQ